MTQNVASMRRDARPSSPKLLEGLTLSTPLPTEKVTDVGSRQLKHFVIRRYPATTLFLLVMACWDVVVWKATVG